MSKYHPALDKLLAAAAHMQAGNRRRAMAALDEAVQDPGADQALEALNNQQEVLQHSAETQGQQQQQGQGQQQERARRRNVRANQEEDMSLGLQEDDFDDEGDDDEGDDQQLNAQQSRAMAAIIRAASQDDDEDDSDDLDEYE